MSIFIDVTEFSDWTNAMFLPLHFVFFFGDQNMFLSIENNINCILCSFSVCLSVRFTKDLVILLVAFVWKKTKHTQADARFLDLDVDLYYFVSDTWYMWIAMSIFTSSTRLAVIMNSDSARKSNLVKDKNTTIIMLLYFYITCLMKHKSISHT